MQESDTNNEGKKPIANVGQVTPSDNAIVSPEETTVAKPAPQKTQEEMAEVFESLPPEMKKFFSMSLSSYAGPMLPPFFKLIEKFTSEHITKYLELSGKDDEHDFKLKSSNRWFHLGYTLVIIIVFIFLVVFLTLKNNTALLMDILKVFFGFVGGLGGGFWIRSYFDKNK